MKSFWSGWKYDTSIQREEIAITVIQTEHSVFEIAKEMLIFAPLMQVRYTTKNMLQRSARLLYICEQILYVWDSCSHDTYVSCTQHI